MKNKDRRHMEINFQLQLMVLFNSSPHCHINISICCQNSFKCTGAVYIHFIQKDHISIAIISNYGSSGGGLAHYSRWSPKVTNTWSKSGSWWNLEFSSYLRFHIGGHFCVVIWSALISVDCILNLGSWSALFQRCFSVEIFSLSAHIFAGWLVGCSG